MQDQAQGQPGPLLLRHHPAHLVLDLHRVAGRDQAQPVGQADHVRVDREARHAEARAQDDVGRLAADSRHSHQVFHGVRYLAAEQLDQLPARGDDPSRLGPEESGWLDQLLNLGGVGRREVHWRRMPPEQLRRNEVDRSVGRLCRQDRRDQELEGALMG